MHAIGQRILLVAPVPGTASSLGVYCRHSVLDPVALECLAAAVTPYGYDVALLVVDPGHAHEFAARLAQIRPSVVGLTAMTHEFPGALALARAAKSCDPNIITVFGGYHVSALPGVVEDPAIDYVVIGEGERTFVELLDVVHAGKDPAMVRGVVCKGNFGDKRPSRERIEDLDELPFPVRDREILKECRVGGLAYPAPSKQVSVCQVTYSRGCPHSCKFCCSPKLWGRQVRWRSAGNLVEELELLQKEYGTNLAFFTDLTFNASKAKVLEFCREKTARRVEMNWFPMCRVDGLDVELLTAMRDAGCTKISFGVDATSDATLSDVKPGQGMTLSGIRDALEMTSQLGIIVRGYVIIGYPMDTRVSLREAGAFLRSLAIDDLRMSFLTPFPGTSLYDEFRGKGWFLTDDFSRFTSEEPILKIPDLPPEVLIAERDRIFSEFYNSTEYEDRKREKLRKFPHLKQSYEEFHEFLSERGVLR